MRILIDKIKKWDRVIFYIVGIYLLFSGVRIIIASYMHHIVFYPDELLYHTFAYNFAHGKGLTIYGVPSRFYKVLYSLIITPALFFKSMEMQNLAIAIINSLVMNAGIFPVYLLARDILGKQHRKMILLVAIMYCLLPDLTFTQGYMTEVLYLPFSTLILYGFYKMFDNQLHWKLSCVMGFGLVLLYTNRSIALFIVLSYVLFMCIYGVVTVCHYVKDKVGFKEYLPNIINAIIMGIVFLIFWKINELLFSGNEVITTSVQRVTQSHKMFYYTFYALKMYIMGVLFAIGILPVIMPVVYLRDYDEQDRKFVLFLIINLLVAISITIFKITLREDLGTELPRLHLRYMCYMWIPLVIVFIKLIYNLSIKKVIDKKKFIITCGVSAIYVIVFVFFYSGTWAKEIFDHPMMNILNNLWPEMKMIISAFLGCFFILVLFEFFISPKRGLYIFLSVFMIMASYNNYYESNEIKSVNAMEAGIIDDCKKLNRIVNNHHKQFMMISDSSNDYQGAIDTYVIHDNFVSVSSNDLFNQRIKYPEMIKMANPYWLGKKLLRKVDYIVVNKERSFYLSKNDCFKREDMKLHHFDIYELKDYMNMPRIYRKLYLGHEIVCNLDGLGSNLLDNQINFKSDFKQKFAQPYCSGKKKGRLLYGLSAYLPSGKYEVTLKYSADKDDLGLLSLKANKDMSQYDCKLKKDVHKQSIVFESEDALEDFDIVVESYHQGLKINQVIIKKIEK